MKKSRLLGVVCAYAVWVVTSTVAWAAPVTITDNSVIANAVDVSADSDSTTTTAIPTTGTLTASVGNSSSTTNFNYSNDTNSTTFVYDFTHGIDNTVGDTTTVDVAQSLNTSLFFTVNVDATYSIDGLYSMTGPSGTRITFGVELFDVTGIGFMFKDFSSSNSTANESFVLGVIGDGDRGNSNLGAQTGTLLAGRDYRLDITSRIRTLDAIDQVSQVAATATGDVNLHINAVPVPAAVWLFGSGLLGLVGIARSKKA